MYKEHVTEDHLTVSCSLSSACLVLKGSNLLNRSDVAAEMRVSSRRTPERVDENTTSRSVQRERGVGSNFSINRFPEISAGKRRLTDSVPARRCRASLCAGRGGCKGGLCRGALERQKHCSRGFTESSRRSTAGLSGGQMTDRPLALLLQRIKGQIPSQILFAPLSTVRLILRRCAVIYFYGGSLLLVLFLTFSTTTCEHDRRARPFLYEAAGYTDTNDNGDKNWLFCEHRDWFRYILFITTSHTTVHFYLIFIYLLHLDFWFCTFFCNFYKIPFFDTLLHSTYCTFLYILGVFLFSCWHRDRRIPFIMRLHLYTIVYIFAPKKI